MRENTSHAGTSQAAAAPERTANAGFTLIELLIAVTIFAIVTAIAIPAYNNYSERGFRTELMADLLNCAQAIERFNAINFTYVGVTTDGAADGVLAPAICAPLSAQQGRYAIGVETTVDTYLLTATPQAVMDGDGVITLDEAGNRVWDQDNDGIDIPQDQDWEED
ncbi:MAG: type IV pilin protein [Pseudomonadota bacterium]